MNKTPEEILVEQYGCSDFADLQKCFLNDMISFSMIRDAMEEYGKQQYNQAIKDAAENATIKVVEYSKHGGKIISSCDLGEEISADGYQQYYQVNKESILKLLKP